MNYLKNILFVILLFISLIIADTGYNTIYLMEFENQQNEFTNSHLTEALPDLIKENYKFREDIKVEYAGDIRPYLNQNQYDNDNTIKGLIINGRFLTLNDEFFVEFEAYDIHNWKRLARRQLFCPVQDLICVHDGFLMAIEQSISPFLTSSLDIDKTIANLDQKLKKRTPSYDLDNNVQTDLNQLDNLDIKRKDTLSDKKAKQGQYGDRYYREFDFKNISPDPDYLKKQNTSNLIQILDEILSNPYDVLIGDLSLVNDPKTLGNLLGNIPIEYSIKSSLAQDLLSSIPHEKSVDDRGNIILKFDKNNFIFDEILLEKIALMKFQLMPVIFLNSRIGSIQYIIIDSWDTKHSQLEINNIPLVVENKFLPLFALTPGIEQVQLDLNISKIEVEYNFSIPYEKLGEYTKVAVKFMKEEEINKLLKEQNQRSEYNKE